MPRYGFNQGIARNASQAEYPATWNGLISELCPSAGIQGTKLFDFALRNHGVLTNGPTWVASSRGTVLNFVSGSSQYVVTPAIPKQPTGNTNASMMAWCNPSNILGLKIALHFGTDTIPGKLEYFIYRNLATWVTEFGSSNGIATSAGLAVAGVWEHVAATFDGATNRLYINGELAASTAFSTANWASTGFRIGAYLNFNSVYANFWDGQIDDARLYRRTLSANEIMQIYMGANPLIRKQEIAQFKKQGMLRYRTASRARQLMAT